MNTIEEDRYQLATYKKMPIAAERGDDWPDDSKRPLTERGMSRFKESVGGLKALDAVIDEIFSSPLVRARQTADLLAAGVEGASTGEAARRALCGP